MPSATVRAWFLARRPPEHLHYASILARRLQKASEMPTMNGVRKKQNVRRSVCAVACTLDIIGDRWTLLVVRDLLRGRRYFDELLRSPEGIATNILSARLQALCAQGLVEKTPDPSDHRRHTYKLTDKGRTLGEIVGKIAAWGLKNLPGTKVMGGMRPNLGNEP